MSEHEAYSKVVLLSAIERLNDIIRATKMERDAGNKVADNLRAKIKEHKALLTRAANALTTQSRGEYCDENIYSFIRELRKAAE